MDPVRNPAAYDFIILGGRRSPGVCNIGEPMRDEGWDAPEAKGTDGATLVHNGAKTITFQVVITLWLDELRDCFAEWESWKDVLLTSAKDGEAQQALDIYHPVLAELGITSVVVAKWHPPIPKGSGGSATVKIEFIENRRVQKKLGTGIPRGSKANGVNLLAGIEGSGGGGLGAAFGNEVGGGTLGPLKPRQRSTPKPRPDFLLSKDATLKEANAENRAVHNGGKNQGFSQ